MPPFEVIEVSSLAVSCDGSSHRKQGGALGHPRVYLHIDPDKGEITCPYCSRQYVLRLLAGQGSH